MYRFEARIIGRSQGKSATKAAAHNTGKRSSAVASAAYLSRESITDAKGQTWDYSRHFGGAGAKLLLPAGAPDWMQDRAELWRAVEKVENRKDSMLARDYIITMPYGLTEKQMWACVQDFARQHFVSKGKPADIGLHLYGEPWKAWSKATKAKVEDWKAQDLPFYEQGKVPADSLGPHILIIRGKQGQVKEYARYQPHMHVMTTFRKIDANRPTGFARHKETVTKGHWAVEDKAQLLELRKGWAATLNRHLEMAGLPERVDHRSLQDRGITDRKPMPKKGPVASKMERDGRGDEAYAIVDVERVTEVNRLTETLKKLDAEIHDLTVTRLKRQAAGDDPMEINVQQFVEIEAEQKKRIAGLARERDRDTFFKGFEDVRLRYASEQGRREEERRTRDPAGDIADARKRWERAIGQSYDARMPEESLALAVGIEATQFRKEQFALRERERAEKDPEQRKLLELRRHIEACDYMAQANERLAAISGVIHGRRDNETSNRDRERAAAWQQLGQGLRVERADLQRDIQERRQARTSGRDQQEAGNGQRNAQRDQAHRDQMARTHDRMAAVSDVLGGRGDNETSNRHWESAAEWRRQGQGQRPVPGEPQHDTRQRAPTTAPERQAEGTDRPQSRAEKAQAKLNRHLQAKEQPDQQRDRTAVTSRGHDAGDVSRERSDRAIERSERQVEQTDRRQSRAEKAQERLDRHMHQQQQPDPQRDRSRGRSR